MTLQIGGPSLLVPAGPAARPALIVYLPTYLRYPLTRNCRCSILVSEPGNVQLLQPY